MNWYKLAQPIITYNEALKLLNLSSNYTASDVKNAYRKLMSRFHPDVNPDPKALDIAKKLNVAKKLLLDFLNEREDVGGIQPPPTGPEYYRKPQYSREDFRRQ
jgi:curved DNA-binding protein CbpA